jgi:hypothetical protein
LPLLDDIKRHFPRVPNRRVDEAALSAAGSSTSTKSSHVACRLRRSNSGPASPAPQMNVDHSLKRLLLDDGHERADIIGPGEICDNPAFAKLSDTWRIRRRADR